MEKIAWWEALWFALFVKYYQGDQMKENEMGRAFNTQLEIRNKY
jgi:hypothetical protein